MGRIALCPGTFDPVTNGHLDVIERASRHFDSLVVAVLENRSKDPLVTLEERLDMLREICADLPNVEIASFTGLLADFAKQREIGVIVKGLRAVSDFDYELQMAQMNYRLEDIDTFFIATNPWWSFLSSSLVKEVAKFGGDVAELVPTSVLERLQEKMGAP
ncbi:MAG: pantetheine-phosphate adenylyltransferase [Actinobacteria bacterium]|nr:pantetheine-phosphate adenylyltransferase [Actinomycetota bacterium]